MPPRVRPVASAPNSVLRVCAVSLGQRWVAPRRRPSAAPSAWKLPGPWQRVLASCLEPPSAAPRAVLLELLEKRAPPASVPSGRRPGPRCCLSVCREVPPWSPSGRREQARQAPVAEAGVLAPLGAAASCEAGQLFPAFGRRAQGFPEEQLRAKTLRQEFCGRPRLPSSPRRILRCRRVRGAAPSGEQWPVLLVGGASSRREAKRLPSRALAEQGPGARLPLRSGELKQSAPAQERGGVP